MNLVERAKNMIVSPKTEWPVVEAESSSVSQIYTNYLVILAAIPALASFIGLSVVGISGFGFSYRVPILTGLTSMVVNYVMSLVMVFVLGLIANALAPTFNGQQNPLNAFKLAAFSMTPGLVAGIFQILPALGILSLLASLYGIYVLYLGVPVLMKAPEDKAAPYTAVIVVAAIVIGVVIGVISSAMTGPVLHPRL